MSIRKRTWTTSKGERRTGWVVDYKDQNGKRRLKTFEKKKDADAWWEGQAAYEVRQGIHTPDSASITVKEAAERWLEAVQRGRGTRDPVEANTLRQYKNHVNRHIVPKLGKRKLSQLSTPEVNSYRDELLDSLSRAMARKVLTSLKSIISEAQAQGLVARNVAAPVKISVGSRHRKQVEMPSREQVKALLAKLDELATQTDAKQAKAWRRWRALITTAAQTGMRASELRGLRWQDVDLEAGIIAVNQRADETGRIGPTKSESGRRTIPIPSPLVTLLKAWKLECPKSDLGLVFPTWKGGVEALANIHRTGWKPVLRACKLPSYTFHALRHFHASRLIATGANPKEVQTEMGHSTIQVTYDLYGKLFPEDADARQKRAEAMAAELA